MGMWKKFFLGGKWGVGVGMESGVSEKSQSKQICLCRLDLVVGG